MHNTVSVNTLPKVSGERVEKELVRNSRKVNSSVLPFVFLGMVAVIVPDIFQFPDDWKTIMVGRFIIFPFLVVCWWLNRKRMISGYWLGTVIFSLVGTQPGVVFHFATPETLLPVNVVLFSFFFGVGFLISARFYHVAIIVGITISGVVIGIATTDNYGIEEWATQAGILNLLGIVFAFVMSRIRIKLQTSEIKSRLALEDSMALLDAQNQRLQEAKVLLENSNKALEMKVTERTASLRKSYSEMDAVIYRLSHDFKMPMVNVRSLVLMARDEAKGESISKILNLIESSLDSFDGVLEDMNRFVAFSNRELEIAECSLTGMLENVWENTQIGRDVEFELVFQEGLPDRIHTDSAKLELVLDCLFRNAYQYKKEDIAGQIQIEGCFEGQGLRLLVKDNGIGIDSEVMPKVFDLFFRGNSLSKGLGLGLYLAKGIMEQLGGTLSLTSDGEGTTAELFIPNAQI